MSVQEPPARTYEGHLRCPVEVTLSEIGGKWKLRILWHLLKGTKRFGELKKALPGITQQMLTAQLREMEAGGLISRTVYAVVPPKVEYCLTDYGISVEPILRLMYDWGANHQTRKQRCSRSAARS